MKKITAKLATVKNYYEIIKDLDLQLVNDDVFFEDDLIYYVYEFVLE
jgi:hypothetical protein